MSHKPFTMTTSQNILDCFLIEKEELEGKYFKLLCSHVQNWVNENPEYYILAGMGTWSLNLKDQDVNFCHESGTWFFVDHDSEDLDWIVIDNDWGELNDLIQEFANNGIWLDGEFRAGELG